MAKKKKKAAVAEPAEERPRQTVTLYGKDVIKDGKVDQKINLRIAGKITEIGRSQYDKDRLHQTIEIVSVKKMLTGTDLDAKISEKVNDA